MKKVFALLFLLGTVVTIMAAEATYLVSGDYNGTPSNIWTIKLKDTETTTDTIYVDSSVVYGPFNLCAGVRRPSAKGFQAYMPVGGVAAGDSVQLAYQIIPTGAIQDTGSTWTAVDTLITGKTGSYVDISSKAGKSIAFRILNIDGTKTGMVANKKIKIAFITAAQEEK